MDQPDIFTTDGVQQLIDDLTVACVEASEHKEEAEGILDLDGLENRAKVVMSEITNMPMYDAIMILSSCLVRVLNDALEMNALGQDQTNPNRSHKEH